MISFGTEQTIDRPADEVWAYAADILRHPEWMGVTDAAIGRAAPSPSSTAPAAMRQEP